MGFLFENIGLLIDGQLAGLDMERPGCRVAPVLRAGRRDADPVYAPVL